MTKRISENVSPADVREAMYARIGTKEPFQAKTLTDVGIARADAEYVKQDGGAYAPVSRIADRLLQFERKAGRIRFEKGWWKPA